jgi:hypothetical protein
MNRGVARTALQVRIICAEMPESIGTKHRYSSLRFLSTGYLKQINKKLQFRLELAGFRNTWLDGMFGKIEDRLKRPRFGFPGVFDRAPPPPKTLHWKFAPKEGEYFKLRAMLGWAVLHLAIIGRRLGDHPSRVLLYRCLDRLEVNLVTKWLPEASIPAFSVKGEAKKLTDDFRKVLEDLSACPQPNSIVNQLWDIALKDLGLPRDDPMLLALERYIEDQERFLKRFEIEQIIENSDSWGWIDVSHIDNKS